MPGRESTAAGPDENRKSGLLWPRTLEGSSYDSPYVLGSRVSVPKEGFRVSILTVTESFYL